MRAVRRSLFVLASLGAMAACGSDAVQTPGNLDAGGGRAFDGSATTGQGDSGKGSGGDAGTEAATDGGPDIGPFPLGTTWGNEAVHFRVMASPALAVELDLYAVAMGAGEVLAVPMTRASSTDPWAADVTHAQLAAAGIGGAVYYGYRAWGPNWTKDPSWTKGSQRRLRRRRRRPGQPLRPQQAAHRPLRARDLPRPAAARVPRLRRRYSTRGTTRGDRHGPLASKSIVFPPDTAEPRRAPDARRSRTTSSTRSRSVA